MAQRKKIKVAHHSDSEDENQQVARTMTRKWKGLLQELPNLPIDLLHEVFKHLTPLDLLHLARTTKIFRTFLLRRNTIGIWRSARQNVEGLPECPPYLSEPAYANLMFSPHCHQCLTGHIQNIILPFSVRYCNACKKTQCVESYLLGGRGGYAGGLTDDMFCSVSGERRKVLYHKPEVERVWEEWLSLPAEDTVREEFRRAQQERVHQITQHSSQCSRWVECRRASRAEELKSEKNRKLEQVIERLTALGWGEELDDMKSGGYYQLKEHATVRQLKRVNEKTWSEVEKPLVAFMRTCKKTRLLRLRRQQIRDRLNLLASVLKEFYPPLRTTDTDLGPEIVDFAMMPEIRRIADAPSTTTITRDDFLAIKDQLSEWADEWVLQVHLQLCHVASGSRPCASDGINLFLATTFFDCTHCGKRAMQFPAVCAHECLRSRYYRGMETEDSAYLYQDVAYSYGNTRVWSCQPLVRSPTSDRASKVIKAFGEDPLTAQQLDMNKTLRCVCCKTCSRAGVKVVMDWRSAVEHCRLAHSAIDQEEAEFEMVSDAEAAKARELQTKYVENALDHLLSKIQWSCARCMMPRYTKMALGVATEHVRLVHQVATPNPADGDIYVSGDSPPLIGPPVLLVSRKAKRDGLTPAEKKYCKEGTACLWEFDELARETIS